MGTGSLPEVKRPGRGADHPLPSKRRGHEKVGLYLYSSSGPSWPVKGRTFTFTVHLFVERSETQTPHTLGHVFIYTFFICFILKNSALEVCTSILVDTPCICMTQVMRSY